MPSRNLSENKDALKVFSATSIQRRGIQMKLPSGCPKISYSDPLIAVPVFANKPLAANISNTTAFLDSLSSKSKRTF